MTLSLKILWTVKILLALRKASEAGAPPMKSRELMAACLNPGADTYMYRRVLRELAAKTDYATCIIQWEGPTMNGIATCGRRSTT